MNQGLIRLLFGLLAGMISCFSLQAEPVPVQVGRYAAIAPTPTPSQKDLLSIVVQMRFHANILTVGEALDYLLLRSGYRLSNEVRENPALVVLSQYPLPEVHRELGPITLREAMTMLAGPAYQLVENHYQREISFQLVGVVGQNQEKLL